MRKKLRENSETRIITRFLWLPVAIGNDWRWLEKASYVEEYWKSKDSLAGFWQKIRWCEAHINIEDIKPEDILFRVRSRLGERDQTELICSISGNDEIYIDENATIDELRMALGRTLFQYAKIFKEKRT